MSAIGPVTLTIDHLGARGDGVARLGPTPVYVPGALPGERVQAEGGPPRLSLVAVEEPSPERIAPFCPYFDDCGGCAAQHMAPPLYRAWKLNTLATALRAAGLDPPVRPLIDAHGEGRRRLTLHARTEGREARVGFMAARSHRLVAIALCPIAEPALAGAADAARALAAELAGLRKPLDCQVTASEAGLDIDLRGAGRVPEPARQALIRAAERLDLARLSLHGEVLVERRPPAVAMGRARPVPPPGAFLQATRAGETVLAALVGEALAGARRVADLFAGCGPFALRLAEAALVHAVEADAPALASLERAARSTPGLKPVTTEARDLFRRPLLPPELDRFDAVVLDPPRAGAEAQARQLALSRVPRVASVSCDPASFARDAALLVAGGYALESVTPVDQFKYSPHLELVGVFRREPTKRRR